MKAYRILFLSGKIRDVAAEDVKTSPNGTVFFFVDSSDKTVLALPASTVQAIELIRPENLIEMKK